MQGSDCMKGCLEYDHCDVSIVLGSADPLGHDNWALIVVFHYLCSAAMLPSPTHHSPWLAWTLYTLETESIFCRAFKYLCLRSQKKKSVKKLSLNVFPLAENPGTAERRKESEETYCGQNTSIPPSYWLLQAVLCLQLQRKQAQVPNSSACCVCKTFADGQQDHSIEIYFPKKALSRNFLPVGPSTCMSLWQWCCHEIAFK